MAAGMTGTPERSLIHVFTSVTCNYIPKARVLAESVKRLHPEIRFHLVLADAVPSWLCMEEEPFDELIQASELGIRDIDQWLFKHSVVEACTGVKGPALVHLLSRPQCDAVLYFDPDIVVLSRLDELIAEFRTASVLLTPHLTEPEKTVEAILDNEFSVLQHGIYNLGFVGVRKSDDGLRFAQWWADRLEQFCYDDIPRGLFTDQRWADLAPAYFSGVRVLRSPQYNVCTWNLTHRRVGGSFEDGFTVNGLPLVFYHFSGFDSGAQKAMLDRYGSGMPALYELRDWYVAECDAKGQEQLGNLPWAYGNFDNGRRIGKQHRVLYRDRGDLQKAFPNPYTTADVNRSYFHWFESNDESRAPDPVPQPSAASQFRAAPAPVPFASPSPTPADPDYRVIVSLCGMPVQETAERAAQVRARTFRNDRMVLAGPPAALEAAVSACGVEVDTIALPEESAHEQAFRAVVARFGNDKDFAFVAATVEVPELWDLRLAWTAHRVPGIATASPMHPAFEFASVTAEGSVPDLDSACYANSLLSNPDVPRFFEDCFYCNHSALAEAGGDTRREFSSAASRLRWSHVAADHLFTSGTVGQPEAPSSDLPAPVRVIAEHLGKEAAHRLSPAAYAVRRQLHVMHSWGGGLDRWVRDYTGADTAHDSFILRSIGTWGAFGQELRLFRNGTETEPIRRWAITPAIKGTATVHTGYRAALDEIINDYGIDALIVSSVVGHSLDVFRTGLQTLMVCHDFYPFCPALNITFNGVCTRCEHGDLEACTRDNPHNRFFRNVPPAEWVRVREEFGTAVTVNGVSMIAPTPSVRDLYTGLVPALAPHFQVIPHGTHPVEGGPLKLDFRSGRRLRIVMIGSLAPNKGEALLASVLPELLTFADLYLVGCGEYGRSFERQGVIVIPEYQRSELREILQGIAPDAGLLLSVVPETFSYTLQELFEMAIPPVATRIGSFGDRIHDGEDGFLVEPDPRAVLAKLRALSESRALLATVHERLSTFHPRTIDEMLADYEAVIGLGGLSARAYFAPERRAIQDRAVFGLMTGAADTAFFEIPVSVEPRLTTVAVPDGAALRGKWKLRLDPGAAAVVIFRMRLAGPDDETLWSWSSRQGKLDPGNENDIVWLGGAAGALLYVFGPEPRLNLPVDEQALAKAVPGSRFSIELAFPQLGQAVARMAAAFAENGQIRLDEEERGSLLEFVAGQRTGGSRMRSDVNTDRLLADLEAARSRVTDLEQSLSWRITEPLRKAGTLAIKALRRNR